MRWAPLSLLLVSCGAPNAGDSANGGESVPDDRIDCRAEGSAAFERNCIVETEGRMLTIRKPDGGFRRLRITDDGSGVAAADGAEPAIVTLLPDGRIEVAIGGDLFRLPARVRGR
jgi:hypothetical protein